MQYGLWELFKHRKWKKERNSIHLTKNNKSA
jgi:hypothetical protein